MAKRKTATNLRRKAKNGSVAIVEVMKTNAEGQASYEIQDPSERLVATIGTSMNEPKFYPTDAGTKPVGHEYDASDFDAQAQLVVNTAFEVANSESPKDLVQIAHWARKELRMRTMPQVLLAIAAECEETKQYVKEYTPKIVNRADELKQAFVAYRTLFGTNKSLPNSLKRGLAQAFSKYRERDFLKYEGQGRPYFGDILKMIDRRAGWPLEKTLDHYLKTGEILDDTKVPIVASRKKLTKLKTFGPRAKELARKSGATWEVLLSQFGNTKEVWEHLIETEQLGYMATLRNMRNILQAGVSEKHRKLVTQKIVSGAVNSKQLPFRFLSAKVMLENDCPTATGVRSFYTALDKAAEAVANAGFNIPGTTLSATDTSGSMESTVSAKSKMTVVGAAAMLAGILNANSAKGSVAGIFASHWKELKGTSNLSPLQLAQKIMSSIGVVGHGTSAERVLEWAIRNNKKFDRIVIFSDLQTYGGGWGGRDVSQLWKEYKRKVNPNAKLHTVDLAGYGHSVAEQADDSVNVVNGFSDKILDTILRFEGISPDTGVQTEEDQEFTIEYIRKNY